MPVIEFLENFIDIAEWILSILGIVLFALGYKLARVIYLVLGVCFGFTLGFLVGFVVGSTALSVIIGLILGSVFGFFNFVHYHYVKGVSLGILASMLCLYMFLVILNYATFSLLIIPAVSIVVSFALAVLSYRYEVITTMFVTAWLGAVFIVYAVLDVFVVLDFSLLTAFISLVVGMLGFALQYMVVHKKMPKQI